MRTKIKTLSLVLAASFVLNGCNSGSTASSPTSSSTSAAPTATAVQSTAATEEKGMISWLSTGASIISGGYSAISWLVNYMQTGSLSNDDTTKKLNEISTKLDEIGIKIDTVQKQMEAEINVSTTTLETLNSFYLTYTENQFSSSFKELLNDHSAVNLQYNQYIHTGAFGDATPESYTILYSNAKKLCNDTKIQKLLEDGVSSSSNQVTTSAKTGAIFLSFVNGYANTSTPTSGHIYSDVSKSKASYLNALGTSALENVDMAAYLDYYDVEITNHRVQLLSDFQKIYNMQVTQLAYHYACGTSVDALTNINSKDLPSGNDQQAFEKSIEVLNAKYNTYFTQLNANLSKYMAPFTNKERYTVVNNIFDGLSFLNSTYFNTADSADNSCGVTKLNFKNLGTSDKKNFGVLSMNTSCYTKDAKYPYHDYKFEIPYVLTDAKKVKSIAINKIGFSKESDIPIYSRPSGTADLTADDIANIGSKDDTICSSFWLDDCKSVYHWAEDINFFGVNSNVKYMGYSTGVNIKPETGSAYVLFADKVGRKSIDDQADWVKNLFFYHDSKVEPLEYQSSSDQLHRNGPPANPTISHYVSDLNHDHQYQEYAFATYNGKTFLVKLITEHKGETNAKTRVSIGCLSDANGCRRLDAKSTDSKDEINKGTVLYWNDGTSVRLYVKDNGASSYTHASLRNPYVYIGGTNVGGAVRSPHEVGSKADGSVCPTGEEVITDKATNLMWVRKPKSATYNWSDAQLPPAIPTSYCGYTDWRLPSKDEMKGLINQAEAGGGAWVHYANWFNTIGGFSGIGTSDKYWISTKHPVSGWAFYAMLETGDSSIPGHASESLKVLPVRSIK